MQRIEIINNNLLDAMSSEARTTIDCKLTPSKRRSWESSSTSFSANEGLAEIPELPTPKRIRRSIKLNQEQNEQQQQEQQQHSEPIDPFQEGELLEGDDGFIVVDNTDRNIPWWSRSRVWNDSDSLFNWWNDDTVESENHFDNSGR